MKKTLNPHSRKSGAALVIAIGFLAILTILILAFSAQTRTDRMAGRSFLQKAQTRQLLNAAASRAMEEIERCSGPGFPAYFVTNSWNAHAEARLVDSLEFEQEAAFLPLANSTIESAYEQALNHARWQTITDGEVPLGRVGYIIVNTSGLIDANAVGGIGGREVPAYRERERGISPEEIQLSANLLPELARSGASMLLPDGSLKPTDSAPLALVYNRTHAWRKFETLRDFAWLNENEGILSGPPQHFRSFSFFPASDPQNQYMGSTLDNLKEPAVRQALNRMKITGNDQDFVLQQLKDYIDTDSTPDDLKYSVEPVPLLNEVLFTFDFEITPRVEIIDPDEPEPGEEEEPGSTNLYVVITNTCTLEVEAWIPFQNAEVKEPYTVQVELLSSTLTSDLFPDFSKLWESDESVLEKVTTTNRIYTADFSAEFATSELDGEAYSNLFESITGGVDQMDLTCQVATNITVDRAVNLEFPVELYSASLTEAALNIAGQIFIEPDNANLEPTNLIYRIGMSTIDPRLNWDGTNPKHWVETGDNGYNDTIGEVNSAIIKALTRAVPKDEPRNEIYVRNEGRIDSAYEFTYLLQSINQPWKTFQLFAENNTNETGQINAPLISELLTTRRPSPGRSGSINPNTPFARVLASAFYRMPIDKLVQTEFQQTRRMDAQASLQLAEEIYRNRPYRNRSEMMMKLSYEKVSNIIGGSTWEQESLLRNAMDLLETRDSTYTVLLAAQSGQDRNADGDINDDEVAATQKGLIDVWRDPQTGKAACVFLGLDNAIRGPENSGMSALLQSFKPE